MIVSLNLSVLRGDVDAARDEGASIEQAVQAWPQPVVRNAPRLALAQLDLSLGDSGSALERLALSPQCGFASTMEGNRLTADDQRAKLRRVAETARLLWSS